MPWYSAEITAFLYAVWLLASVGTIWCIYRQQFKTALWIILATGFVLRLLAIDLDTFLYEWDERFHALVARNMMDFPFKPMLRLEPVFPYDLKAWCCNHIWLHKQPLFLWQMALSMKIFGASVWAMRLPSAIMGTVGLFFVHEIARYWSNDIKIGVVAAFLTAFFYYQLELISGRLALDHNDLAFAFYVTASMWTLVRYWQTPNYTWAIWTGVAVGCAVLNKWLPGFLVYSGWVVGLLADQGRRGNRVFWYHIVISVLVALAVFLPWQVYIMYYFPAESAASYEMNWRHMMECLDGKCGGPWYHIWYLGEMYGIGLACIAGLGLSLMLADKSKGRQRSILFLVPMIVLFAFFKSHHNQILPNYIKEKIDSTNLIIIDKILQ